ncbi:hypothetical protein NUU61_008829 [Penicillium alfredii]|uniref:Uncharacterized protein n=1 Tax=Penicillium alfredii TaxID=1506179 RepID=A0A9W9EM32_9EURO|nr:uncharacterized protein NUU61_008829 [Penicillium alfredii]KAJ5084250.1 hypothetical protein NUU61_008829 [Penicillium alfredii]
MLLLKNVLFLLFLIFELLLAASIQVRQDSKVQVWQDTSVRNYFQDDTMFLWNGIATFSRHVTDGQLVQIAEDGLKSMLRDARDRVPKKRVPTVMSALVYQGKSDWRVFLSSSLKGSTSMIYEYKQVEGDKACGDMRNTVPGAVKDALSQCAAETKSSQHLYDAGCGEMNILLEFAAKTGRSPRRIAANSRMVTWQGEVDGKSLKYSGGKIKPPCTAPGRFGCDNTLKALTQRIKILSEDTGRRSYVSNRPTSTEYQPLFPGYENGATESSEDGTT